MPFTAFLFFGSDIQFKAANAIISPNNPKISPKTFVTLPLIFLPIPKISLPGVFFSFFLVLFFCFPLSLSVFLDDFLCLDFKLITLLRDSNNFLRASLNVSFDSSDSCGGASSTLTLTFSTGGSRSCTSVDKGPALTAEKGTIAPVAPPDPPHPAASSFKLSISRSRSTKS